MRIVRIIVHQLMMVPLIFLLLPWLLHGFVTPAATSSSRSSLLSRLSASPYLNGVDRVYFDIAVADREVGRLVFGLTVPSPLPIHTENLIRLARGDRRSVDPQAHYVGCPFDYGADYIEEKADMGGGGRYRWSHVLRGRGRNAVEPFDGTISDPENQRQCVQSVYGGQYYAAEKFAPLYEDDPGVLLAVQVAGPGRGSSRFSIVRVGESPNEWGERLLLNCGVIGRLDPRCLDTLHAMARQKQGPPTVVAAGVMMEGEDDIE